MGTSKRERVCSRPWIHATRRLPLPPEDTPSLQTQLLLIEEDVATRRVLRRRLRACMGGAVTLRLAADLREAAALLAEDLPDVIVANARLPDGTGVHLLRRLRGISDQVPVLLHAEAMDFDEADALLRAGAAHVFHLEHTLDPELAARILGAIADARAVEAPDALAGEWRANFGHLAELSGEGILVLDPLRHVVYANAAAASLLATPAEDLLGTTFVYPFSTEDTTRLQMRRASRTPLLVTLRARDASWAGRPATLVILREERTEQALGELQRSTEMQLRDVQRMESLGRVATSLAQDWNNLLTVILGRCELAGLRAREDDGIAHNLQLIEMGARRATAMTRQFLTLSHRDREEGGPTAVAPFFDELQPLLRVMVGHHVDCEVDVPADLGVVGLDAAQLGQVLSNLVLNAREAMPEGGRLDLTATRVVVGGEDVDDHPVPHPGPYACLAVSDTGCGMSADVRKHAFEPFYTTKDRLEAHGLGLARVKGIVEEIGGAVWLDSRPGHGTVVKVYLPLLGIQASEAPRAPMGMTPLTILVVEDEPEVRAIVEEVLAHAGHRVLTAGNGAEAVAVAEETEAPIDLLLLDVLLPGQSGARVAEALSRTCAAADALFMSGLPAPELRRRGLIPEGAHALHKPFVPAELLRAIGERAAARRPTSSTEPLSGTG